MVDYQVLKKEKICSTEPEKLKLISGVRRIVKMLAPQSTLGLKLVFYDKLIGFVQTIALQVLSENNLIDFFCNPKHPFPDDADRRIFDSLQQLLYHFELTEKAHDRYLLKFRYQIWSRYEEEALRDAVEKGTQDLTKVCSPFIKKLIQDFLFIQHLISLYRNEEVATPVLQKTTGWKRLIEEGKLDYEIRLCETLKELAGMDITKKMSARFEESYYTSSGENAFKNFTRPNFVRALKHIVPSLSLKNVWDIGCGYGNYIEAVLETVSVEKIYGIELQNSVFKEAQKRFARQEKVELLHQNIFEAGYTAQEADLILLNYVLFYFSTEEQKKLFKQLYEMLSPQGSLLICQYYPGIEPFKKEIARHQNEYSFIKKMEMYYSNKTLYANALWNDVVDVFAQAEKWDTFLELIEETGWKINSVTRADKFYYSLFVELKKQ